MSSRSNSNSACACARFAVNSWIVWTPNALSSCCVALHHSIPADTYPCITMISADTWCATPLWLASASVSDSQLLSSNIIGSSYPATFVNTLPCWADYSFSSCFSSPPSTWKTIWLAAAAASLFLWRRQDHHNPDCFCVWFVWVLSSRAECNYAYYLVGWEVG